VAAGIATISNVVEQHRTVTSRPVSSFNFQVSCSNAEATACRDPASLEYDLLEQTGWLFLLAIPVASISWTITHEEVFREAANIANAAAKAAATWWCASSFIFYLDTVSATTSPVFL